MALRRAPDQLGLALWADVFPEDLAPSAEEQVIEHAPSRRLCRAVEELASTEPLLHEVLVRSIDGIPTPVAARELNIPQGTASDRLRRARAAVRAILRRWAVEEAHLPARKVLCMLGASPPMEPLEGPESVMDVSLDVLGGSRRAHPCADEPVPGREATPSARR